MRAALTLRSLVGMIALVTVLVGTGWAQSKAIHTQKTKDAVITLKSESGRWSPGPNSFVIELTTPDGQPSRDGGLRSVGAAPSRPAGGPRVPRCGVDRPGDARVGRELGGPPVRRRRRVRLCGALVA